MIKTKLIYVDSYHEQTWQNNLELDLEGLLSLLDEIEERTIEDITDQDFQNNIHAILNGVDGIYSFNQKNDITLTVII